jgi:hypothetical protein
MKGNERANTYKSSIFCNVKLKFLVQVIAELTKTHRLKLRVAPLQICETSKTVFVFTDSQTKIVRPGRVEVPVLDDALDL